KRPNSSLTAPGMVKRSFQGGLRPAKTSLTASFSGWRDWMTEKPQCEIFQCIALAEPFCQATYDAGHRRFAGGRQNLPVAGVAGTLEEMSSLDKYIFRTTFGAFALIAVCLTLLIWVTQALREIDLMTNQGQAVLVFVGMTGLLIPVLVLIIAPIALMVAVTYSLNKLNADSEMIVMSAAGISPWRLFVPFVLVALVVSLLVAVIGAYLGPKGLRELRTWAAQLRADLVSTIVKPGRFTTIEKGLTFHIRERRPNGQLLGILIDDRRDSNERATFLAERGEILENEGGTFLVLESGSVQRREQTKRDPTIVRFDRYAFDLSHFSGGAGGRVVSARERY